MWGMGVARHVLISCVKDEGPFILEWVAHHLVLGFDAIYVASNDCTDGTDRLLSALGRAGFITHVANVVGPDDIPQHAGYALMRRKYPIDAADWLMMLDADEFLNVHHGAGTVQALTGCAKPDIDVIALCAKGFTGAPHLNWQPGRVCARFTQTLAPDHKTNGAVKSLTRGPARFRQIHNHSMVGWRGPGDVQVMRADGTRFSVPMDIPMWKRVRNLPRTEITHALAQYNHYAVKTHDSFALRGLRGRGAVAQIQMQMQDAKARHTDDYFASRSVSYGEDHTIARYSDQVIALLDKMLAQNDIQRLQKEVEAIYALKAAPFRLD